MDNLIKLMRNVNFKLFLDLNLQLRYGTQWDPTNTATLLGYINKMKYHDVFNFELGNGKPKSFSIKLSLRAIVNPRSTLSELNSFMTAQSK